MTAACGLHEAQTDQTSQTYWGQLLSGVASLRLSMSTPAPPQAGTGLRSELDLEEHLLLYWHAQVSAGLSDKLGTDHSGLGFL